MIKEVLKVKDLTIPQCNSCKHYQGVRAGIVVCKAYPGGIPDSMLFNRMIHDRIYPAQTGNFVWKQK
jgi:hypothetical protein